MTVPEDFPREHRLASLADAHTAWALRLGAATGKHLDGRTEPEIEARYDVCADLLTQLVEKCRINRATKYAALTEPQILERLLGQLLATGWGSAAEMQWVIRRAAATLGWTVPENAVALTCLLEGIR